MKHIKVNLKITPILLMYFFCSFLFLDVRAQDKKEYVLQGISKDFEESKLFLVRAIDDIRGEKEIIQIQDNKFEKTASLYENEAYLLIWQEDFDKGIYRPIIFFTDHNIIDFVIYGMENFHLNQITGGKSNLEYQRFNKKVEELKKEKLELLGKQRDSLFQENQFFSKEYLDLSASIQIASPEDKVKIFAKRDSLEKMGKSLTPLAKENNEKYLSAVHEIYEWIFNEEMKNTVSIIHLYGMMDNVRFQRNNPQIMNLVSDAFPEYAAYFDGHPYISELGRELRGILGLAVGKKLPEFQAPDLNGELLDIHPLVSQNKITLLNLWGTWCAPCISKTRLIHPLFNDYRNKGFGIVAVAREYKSIESLKKRLEIEFNEWPNLVDLDNQQKIWNLLGISNSAGMMLMLDENGNIIAIDPTVEEVEKILAENLM